MVMDAITISMGDVTMEKAAVTMPVGAVTVSGCCYY